MKNIMGSISDSCKNIDRISNLPNNLITHIISFLLTEDAVRTSALSTHWNQQWTSVTHLIFDDGVLLSDDFGVKRNPNPRTETSFVNFVYRVLLFKVTRLNYFRLQCGRDYGATNVSQWISAALSRDVRIIDIGVPMHDGFLNNDHLFSSRTLVALTLGVGFFLKVPEIISLDSLIILDLGYLQFVDGESISRLVAGCPVLNELKIEGKLGERVRLLNISSRPLKKLILKGLYSDQFSEINGANSYEIALDAPNLEFFEHDDNGLPDGFHTETLQCLDTVKLCLEKSSYQFDEYDDDLILAHSMANLLIAISNVRFLDLSFCYEEALYCTVGELPNYELPVFPHLTSLKISLISLNADLFTAFLRRSPNLSYLSFELGSVHSEFYEPPKDVPFCMLYNLKVIEVCCLELEPGLSMMKYFLKNAMCLEELIIPEWDESNAEVIKEIITLPTASKSCKIVTC